MNSRLEIETGGTEFGWTRVSSFKPYLAGFLLTAAVSVCLMIILREHSSALPLIIAGTVVALGLVAMNSKVIYKRGSEYRITTLFYSEVVTIDDVCMTVTNPGTLWTRSRIHLRRPARFGWMVSFVPASEEKQIRKE